MKHHHFFILLPVGLNYPSLAVTLRPGIFWGVFYWLFFSQLLDKIFKTLDNISDRGVMNMYIYKIAGVPIKEIPAFFSSRKAMAQCTSYALACTCWVYGYTICEVVPKINCETVVEYMDGWNQVLDRIESIPRDTPASVRIKRHREMRRIREIIYRHIDKVAGVMHFGNIYLDGKEFCYVLPIQPR